MLPSGPALYGANRSLPYAVLCGDGGLGAWVHSDGSHLFLGEFAQTLPLAARLPVTPLSYHVGIVVGIGSGEQVAKFTTGGRIAGVAHQQAVSDRTIRINIGGAVDEPKAALPPYAAITVLGEIPLPQAAPGNFIADGVEVDLFRKRDAARG